jgi:hypothetical protein
MIPVGGILDRSGDQHWEPAQVQMPEVPMLPAGEDPMSATISAVLPTLTAPMEANIAALQGKETMFAGKLGASNVAYQGSEDSGQQGVMQVVQSLGQIGSQAGQMGEMTSAPGQMGGQLGGSFASLMQPIMQAFQGAGHGGQGQSFGAQAPDGAAGPAGQGLAGVGSPQQQERDEDRPTQAQPEPRRNADRDDHAVTGPQAGPGDVRHGLSPVPELPPEHSRHDDGDDLARRM